MMPDDSSADISAGGRSGRERSFIGLYAVANVGAFIAFIPLLQVLVPLRAAAIQTDGRASLLSAVSLCGAVAASLANILFGALSDRAQGSAGGRGRWLVGGLFAVLLSYALIRGAGSPLALLLGVVAFQCAFNAMFAPLGAVLADHVSPARRGITAALLGMGYPLGNLVGTQAVGAIPLSETQQFVLVAGIVVLFVAPFAVTLRRMPGRPRRPAPLDRWWTALRVNPLLHGDFAFALLGRLLVVTAFSLVQLYLLVYLRRLCVIPGLVAGRPEAALAVLAANVTGASIVFALIGGAVSDRLDRPRLLVSLACASTALGIGLLGLADSWWALRAGSLVYGCGTGQFYAVDLALIVRVLPSMRSAGKDLGIVNLSNTMGQVIAPMMALAMLSGSVLSFRLLFLAGACLAVLGGSCMLGIKLRPP